MGYMSLKPHIQYIIPNFSCKLNTKSYVRRSVTDASNRLGVYRGLCRCYKVPLSVRIHNIFVELL